MSLDWMDSAACRDYDSELWFNTDDYSKQAAKRICRGCKVRDDCLNWAITTGQKDGTLGGFTEHERKLLIRRQARRAS